MTFQFIFKVTGTGELKYNSSLVRHANLASFRETAFAGKSIGAGHLGFFFFFFFFGKKIFSF